MLLKILMCFASNPGWTSEDAEISQWQQSNTTNSKIESQNNTPQFSGKENKQCGRASSMVKSFMRLQCLFKQSTTSKLNGAAGSSPSSRKNSSLVEIFFFPKKNLQPKTHHSNSHSSQGTFSRMSSKSREWLRFFLVKNPQFFLEIYHFGINYGRLKTYEWRCVFFLFKSRAFP